MMNTRLKKLVEDFSRHKNIDALLIVNDSNIRYLTQFPAVESWLLVTKPKAFYITDSRYILEARQGLKGIRSNNIAKCLARHFASFANNIRSNV